MRNFRNVAIIICDVQTKSIKNLFNSDTVIKNINLLLESKKYVKSFNTIINSELVPEKLGQTVASINRDNIDHVLCRNHYSILDEKLDKILVDRKIQEIILVGMEIQWCINQSVRDLSRRYLVNVPIDAVGNCKEKNEIPFKRLESHGAKLCLTDDIIAENLDSFHDNASKWYLNYLKSKKGQ